MFVIQSKVDPYELYGGFDSTDEAEEWWAKRAALVGLDDLARARAVWRVFEVIEHADPHDHVPYDYHQTFGPGSLESIHLYRWRDDAVKVEGDYTVYCGEGNEHIFHVDSGYIQTNDWEAYVKNVKTTRPPLMVYEFSPQDLYAEAVTDVVNDILDEEWVDPCQQPIESPDDDEEYIEEQDRITRYNREVNEATGTLPVE